MKPLPLVSFRIDNLELRSCDSHLTSIEPASTLEIVQWSKHANGSPYCWTVASWRVDGGGICLQFVDSRPFDDRIDGARLWEMIRFGQKFLADFCRSEDTEC